MLFRRRRPLEVKSIYTETWAAVGRSSERSSWTLSVSGKSKWSGFQEFHGNTVTPVVVVWNLKGLFAAVGHAVIHLSSRSRGRGMENQLFKNELKVVSSLGFIISFLVVAMDSRQESGHTHYKPLSEDHADLRNLKNFAVSLINHFTSYCETIYLTSARFFLRYSATPCNFSAYLLNKATYRAGFFFIFIFLIFNPYHFNPSIPLSD